MSRSRQMLCSFHGLADAHQVDNMASSLPVPSSNGNQALNGRKGGTTKRFPKHLVHTIANTLANSKHSLLQLCSQHPDWPSYIELDHYARKHSWFRRILQEARASQAQFLIENCVDLEQDILNRQKEITMPAVQVNKIVMEQRRWLAGKLLRSVYGDDEKVAIQNQQAVVITSEQLNDLR